MSSTSSRGSISVANTLTEGISPDIAMPTFLPVALGLTEHALEIEIQALANLQNIAPVFRVVLLTDLPAFPAVRALGWPIEHVLAVEHRARTMNGTRRNHYLDERLRIARMHYRDLIVIDHSERHSFAEAVAASINRPDLGTLAVSLNAIEPKPNIEHSHWPSAIAALRTTGCARFIASEGSVNLTGQPTDSDEAILIRGSSEEASTPSEDYSIPGWVGIIEASFVPEASLAFESHVYASLARLIDANLSVVSPWREAATHAEDVLYWLDLAASDDPTGLRVYEHFGDAYQSLSGSDDLDWSLASTYAVARRVSRGASRWKGAL